MERVSGLELAEQLTNSVDAKICTLFGGHFVLNQSDWCVVAIGGYGRRDLCPYSDIDILILLGRRKRPSEIEEILFRIVYPLWNEGLNVSYSVRKVREVLYDASSDFFLKTSLLDARLVCGSESILQKLTDFLYKKNTSLRKVRRFYQDMALHNMKRYEKFGDASYILEPDLKDGKGCLRDYHSILWLGKAVLGIGDPIGLEKEGFLNPLDFRELLSALDFLLRLRYTLHTLSGRKNDRLSFEYQEIIAKELGFEDGSLESAVEAFMKLFHRHALTIKSICDALFLNLKAHLKLLEPKGRLRLDDQFVLDAGLISFTDPSLKRPCLLIKAFEHIAKLGLPLHPCARTFIRSNLDIISEARRDPIAKSSFFHILTGAYPEAALTSMLEMGVLERFIPEFENVKGRIQYDVYHTFTVDMHSIQTLTELKSLESQKPETWGRVKDRTVLYLSALLHDIGKGHGIRHAEEGGIVAYNITRWLELPQESAELVGFLVLNHLALANTAMRRDLSEEKVAFEIAQKMGDSQKLSMLYLLSVADAKATGPSGWNDWKATLFHELYHKSLNILEKGDLKDPENILKLDRKWEVLIKRVPMELGRKNSGRLWALPQVYILNFDIPEIMRHLKLSDGVQSLQDMVIDLTPLGERSLLTIIARDRSGLFAMLAGIMAHRHIEIRSAKIFTWLNGLAVDVFELTPPWPNYEEWDRIPKLFMLVSSTQLDLTHAMSAARPLVRDLQRVKSRKQNKVFIDNNSSDFFTLIEVYAANTLGLLYSITKAMSDLGLNIHRAFVANKGDLSVNVFYVVNGEGEKIEGPAEQKMLAERIYEALK